MKTHGPIIGKGSSKDLYWLEAEPGHVVFEFSDRVSVFDYGALPEDVPGKGAALERSARHFFAVFEREGLRSAFDAALSQRHGACVLRYARHPKFPLPAGLKAVDTGLSFIPLEVIFRWGVPTGSSLLKRDPRLQAGQRFDEPRIEFSTKLEATDRFVDRAEALKLAGGEALLARLEAYAVRAARLMKSQFKAAGLELWDGKIECAVDQRSGEIVMIDAVTPDEVRVTMPGLEAVPLSKELLRQWLGATNWAFSIQAAKKKYGEAWKGHVGAPPRLGAWRLQKFGGLYSALAEALEAASSAPLMQWLRQDARRPRVAVLGSGGREAALKWRLRAEGAEVIEPPATTAGVANAAGAVDAALDTCDAVFVSMDQDLAEGRVDALAARSLWACGPTQAASQLEWSKEFGRQIAAEAGLRQPRFTHDPKQLRSFAEPPVVKCDGLAAGKGVVVPASWAEAEKALEEAQKKGALLLEERLRGFEASAFFALESGYGGQRCRYLGCAQDFKRRFAGNEGPNTGGMGAYAPHPQITADDIALFTQWAQATAEAMARRGTPYNGILYLGLMKDETRGWNLIEYNARFGDPETQALVMSWPERPVLRPLLGLDIHAPRDVDGASGGPRCIALALVNPSYPGPAQDLQLPEWQPEAPDFQIFRTASTRGRVAYLVGRGEDLHEAGDRIFERLVDSPWKGRLEWRADILP